MAIEQQQFHFNSSFTDPKWVPSLFTNDDDVFHNDLLESLLTQQSFTPAVPVFEPEFRVLNQEQRVQPVTTGRVTKRKSRASKRATTTFIAADVSNFRQMVQQVTGIRVATSQVPNVVKPEPCYNATTSFLLDGDYFMNGFLQQPATVVEDGGSAGGFGYDGLCSFPTLESWKV